VVGDDVPAGGDRTPVSAAVRRFRPLAQAPNTGGVAALSAAVTRSWSSPW
jgi:hypothetical protein